MATNNNATFLQWLRQRPPRSLSPQDVAYFIRQAANALQPVHDQQIVHQYVTPASFLLRYNSERPDLPGLQLANFDGTKYSLASNIRQPIVGVPGSMAPEQWQGTVVPATDQYALAIMAYQLLTWQAPFQGDNEQLKYQHLNVQPRPPSTLNPLIPATLDAVILRALAKNPAARYPSISAFADAFQQVVRPPMPLSSPMPVSPASIPGVSSPRQLLDTATISPPPAPNRAPATSSLREVVILAIVFLILVSGIGFGFYSIVKNNQTALNNVNATATPTLTITPIATSIPTAPALTNNMLILSDPLNNNTNGQWDERSTCVFSGGTYHVLVHDQVDYRSFCGLKNRVFDNFAMQVDISLLSAYDVGVLFRYDSGDYYDFEYTSRGTFFFFRFHGGALASMLIPFTASNAIAPGNRKNTLLVIAKGADFELYINSILVGKVQDSNVTRGIMGFEAGTSSTTSEADASFSNFRVYQL